MSLGAFQLDIQRFVDKANGNVDLVVRKVALELFSRVIEKSPVDTGRLRGSWLVGINSVPSGESGVFDKTGSGTIQRVAAEVLNAKGGDVISLISNLSYSTKIEYGGSKQAPAGMVRVSIQEYLPIVNAAAAVVQK